MTENQRSIPSSSARKVCDRVMSRLVIWGNADPYGRPVAGFSEAGPVLPWQPPRTFAQTTKNSLVSIALPGPTIRDHQPSSV